MKETPFWFTSGPDVTGTGVGAARATGGRETRARKVDVFGNNKGVL